MRIDRHGKEQKLIFKPKKPDYELSPYTGLTRDSWLEAGEYLLTGIFQNIRNFEDPVIAKRTEMKITYPHLDAPLEQQESQRSRVLRGCAAAFLLRLP